MHVLEFIAEAVGWVIAASWSTVSTLFWIGVILIAATFLATLFRLTTSEAPAATDPVEAVRQAIRRGELDADIARVEQRNRQRGSLQ